jgi:hypothetical protein
MSETRNDNELRGRFAALREEEAQGRPPFVVPVRRRHQGRLSPAWIAVPVAAAVASFWLIGRDNGEPEVPYEIDLSSTAWVSPTDFLLETPGSGLFTALPTIGDVPPVPDLSATERETDDTAS